MGVVRSIINFSQNVAAQTEVCQTITPPAKDFYVTKFIGSAAFSQNCAVKLVWDMGGAGEQVLWSIKGSSEITEEFELTGDGVKQLAICLDNGLTGPVLMSGFAKIVWEDD